MGLDDILPYAHLLKLGRNVEVHAMLEFFCGVVSFLIAGLLFATTFHNRLLSTCLFGMAFLATGVFDLLHAGTNPIIRTDLFVLFHTLSISGGSILMIVGVAVHLHASNKAGHQRLRPRLMGLLALAMISVALFSMVSDKPADEPSFDHATHFAHVVAGMLFTVAALAAFETYLSKREVLWLVISLELLLLSVSVLLFRLSSLWSDVWWLWHVLKVLFYLGALVIITAQFGLMVRRNELSGRQLAQKHVELGQAHTRLGQLVDDLRVRNWMTNKAASAFGLDATLAVIATTLRRYLDAQHIHLTLYAPVDEVEEKQHRFGYNRDDWSVSVVPVPRWDQELANDPSFTSPWISLHSEAAATSLRFSLRANDQRLGYISVPIVNMQLARERWTPLSDLAAEMGQIFYNSLICEQSILESAFRDGLFKVVLTLRSTLEQGRLRLLFCQEVARLLDSDCATLLYREHRSAKPTAEICGADRSAIAERVAPWLSKRIGRPSSFDVRPFGWAEEQGTLRDDSCVPEDLRATLREQPVSSTAAHAIFPLVEDGSLAGAIAISRNSSVQFSRATLQKGLILVQQLELALENARSCENLRQANLRLRAAERRKLIAERLSALGEVAATVAHEIRNPLGAIINCATVLRSIMPDQKTARTALLIIEEETQRLERLTKNFLNVGKPKGAVPLNFISLEECSDKSCSVVRKHAISKNLPVTVSSEFSGNGTMVLFDADGLREVLMNLMLNAVQAIDGPGHVTLAMRQKATHLFIAVIDNGRGVPPEQREQLFEPFFTGRSEGAGLGLAIVRRLIHSWGGAIRIWTVPSGGSCFAALVPIPHSGVAGSDLLTADPPHVAIA